MKKILIANRGEIAVRIIRACKELSIPTVAVYSSADRRSLHVQLADEAFEIGPPEPLQSYLNMDALISAAKNFGADAIHPGYGFLAENHKFARRCEEEGIIFIGPTSEALKLVGDKVASRETMRKARIPIIPGMEKVGRKLKDFLSWADEIGYPVMVKASLGGGGKGMRIIWSEKELEAAVSAGMREAKSAFGDESIYLEKYLEEPRHVEFQILGDSFGNIIHLFERECSVQRRHQKIVEETPSVAIDHKLRKEMGEVAVRAAKTAGYTNAGTIEFLVDRNKNYYFLEVNARIQVEHPVTELTTGVDLVKEQIRIAAGEKLATSQEDLAQRGHAIECRIYAEDPESEFLPSPGTILYLKEPVGPGIRCDSGIYSGWEVSLHYDPILSKLIVWAEDRESARKRMVQALSQYVILGIKTTVRFLRDIMEHSEFVAGRTATSFIPKNMASWQEGGDSRYLHEALIAAGIDAYHKATGQEQTEPLKARRPTPWQTGGRWRVGCGGPSSAEG